MPVSLHLRSAGVARHGPRLGAPAYWEIICAYTSLYAGVRTLALINCSITLPHDAYLLRCPGSFTKQTLQGCIHGCMHDMDAINLQYVPYAYLCMHITHSNVHVIWLRQVQLVFRLY